MNLHTTTFYSIASQDLVDWKSMKCKLIISKFPYGYMSEQNCQYIPLIRNHIHLTYEIHKRLNR